jgi:hypothetical protein
MTRDVYDRNEARVSAAIAGLVTWPLAALVAVANNFEELSGAFATAAGLVVAVRDLVAGSGLRFEDRGRHALKGLPEDLQVYAALSGV